MRSAGSEVRVATGGRARGLDKLAAFGSSSSAASSGRFGLLGLLGFDDIDAHFVEHRINVFDLVGRDFLGGQNGVQFVMGDEAALLGGLDHPLDGGIGKIEQGAVGRLDRHAFDFALVLVLLCHPSSTPSHAARRGAPAPSSSINCRRPNAGPNPSPSTQSRAGCGCSHFPLIIAVCA